MKRLSILILSAALLSGCGAKTTEVFAPQPSPSAVISESPLPSPSAAPSEAIAQSPSSSPSVSPSPKKTQTVPPEQSPSKEVNEAIPAPKAQTVTISIKVEDESTDILPPTEVEHKEGQTAFDILLQITRERKIQMQYKGSKKAAYIKGINNLYEFDKGGTSGWLYSVNDVYPRISSGAYELKAGDIIKFEYTTKLKQF